MIPEPDVDETEAVHPVAANSTWFENVQEHRFIFDLSRSLYLLDKRLLNVLRSEVDASGFDLTITDGRLTRNVQLKARASRVHSTKPYEISEAIWKVRDSCVIWIMWEYETFQPYCYHLLGFPLPAVSSFKRSRRNRLKVASKKANRKDLKIADLRDILFPKAD